jgi:hypothetical protein
MGARVELRSIANAPHLALMSTEVPVARCTVHWVHDGRKRWMTLH